VVKDKRGWSPLLYADFQGNRESVLSLLSHAGESQFRLLGDLLKERDGISADRALQALKYIATKPEFYELFNGLVRNNPKLLEGDSCSFLRSNPKLLDLNNKLAWFKSACKRNAEEKRIKKRAGKVDRKWWCGVDIGVGESEGQSLHLTVDRTRLADSVSHSILGLLQLEEQGEADFPLAGFSATFIGDDTVTTYGINMK